MNCAARRRPMKRPLLIIAIFLLLGAVVNVAVVWGCARWSVATFPLLTPTSRLPSDADWPRAVPPGWPQPTYSATVSASGVTLVTLYAGTLTAAYAQWINQWGWPLRGLESEAHSWGPPWQPTRLLRPIDPANGFLLICPVWPGFATNTIFYATLLWLLMYGLFALRRFLRVRRGLCPKCAYPMAESSVCTECGCGLPKRARAT